MARSSTFAKLTGKAHSFPRLVSHMGLQTLLHRPKRRSPHADASQKEHIANREQTVYILTLLILTGSTSPSLLALQNPVIRSEQ